MKKFLGVALAAAVLLYGTVVFAGTEEDLRFAEAMFKRKWFDWAMEVAVDLVETASTPQDIKGWAAELHCTILDTMSRATGDDSHRQKADALRKVYKKRFANHPAWGGVGARFAELQRELQKGQDLANKAETEVDKTKRAALMEEALKVFEDLDGKWLTLVNDLRLEVAKYPPEEDWWKLNKELGDKEWERFLDRVWQRDLGEYLYATMFIFYAKVVPEGKKPEILQRGLKKFSRFIDGDKENDSDMDPPAREQKEPQEPSPRTSFNMLLYKAEIGKGQCHLELGNYEDAAQSFDWMIQAELPMGLEQSEMDIMRIVDIRLEAYFLEAFTYNQAKKYNEAVRILTHEEVGMFSQSGKPIQPERPEMAKFWQDEGRPEVANMPNIRENRFGKLASFQLAKAYTALGRYNESIEEVYKIFVIEQDTRTGGQVSPFEVEAAKTMADLSKQIKDVKFPIGAAFAVAQGFYYQQQWDEAIYAYKKVYGSPGSEKEINRYAPKALFELAKLLYDGERYWEAAIAFGEICQRFQDFVQISQAAAMLRASARKAVQAAKDAGKHSKFDDDLYKWANKVAQSAVPASLEKWKEELRRAGDLVKSRDFGRAAEAYGYIPKTYKDKDTKGNPVDKPIPFYSDAQAQAGYCHYALYLHYGKPKKPREPNPKKAREHFDKAVELLKNAINEAAQAERVSGEITGRFYLAKCYVEDMWKTRDEAKKMAREALKLLAPFKDKYAKNEQAKKYQPEVVATTSMAHYRLEEFDKMLAAFKELEKKFPKDQTLRVTAYQLYELMKNQGKRMEKHGTEEDAQPYYEMAGYFIYAWYKASKDTLRPEHLLWAGNALYEGRNFKEASEVLTEYLRNLPPQKDRSEQDENNATLAKIFLAEARYGMGEYKDAARLFDLLRHVVGCVTGPRTNPQKGCGHTERLKPKDFDKQPKKCPQCGEGRLERIHDHNLQIQEGAAKSYLAAYEANKKYMEGLNKAQDIYQRIYGRLVKNAPRLDETGKAKLFEVLYKIVNIWYYKRDFKRIVGDIKNIFLVGGAADPANPTEDEWKKEFPVQPWRGKIRETFEAAKKAQGR
jgi:hypothetical protein